VAEIDSGSTRERILTTALRLFSEQGYESTSLQRLADELGFTKGALYYHFRSKDDLLTSLVADSVNDLEALRDSAQDLDDGQRSHAILRGYIDLIVKNRDLINLLVTERTLQTLPAMAGRIRAAQDGVVRALAGPDPDPSALVRAAAAVGAVQAGMRVIQSDDHLEDVLLAAAEAALRG